MAINEIPELVVNDSLYNEIHGPTGKVRVGKAYSQQRDTIWLVIFVSTNFHERGQKLGLEIFAVSIFVVGDSGTHRLPSGMTKS